jgi:hypothetical protein
MFLVRELRTELLLSGAVAGIQGTDILVLLELSANPPRGRRTVRSIAVPLELSPSVVQKSLSHLEAARLIDDERRPLLGNVEEFLLHGMRYVLPDELGGPTRGMPTAWAAPTLKLGLARHGDIPVWPHPQGKQRGLAIQPISARAPNAAMKDLRLYALLALVDCLRIGDARVRRAAGDEIKQRLREAQ